MAPVVSVNLCCYNSEKYLEETLQSVFAQTYRDWELVIVNDGSTDGTEGIIQRHVAAGRPVVYHAQPNAGLGASRRRAASLSSGRFIAFVDHDDLWMPEKLERQVQLFEANPALGLVYCDGEVIDGAGRTRLRYSTKYRLRRGDIFEHYVRRSFIPPVSVMVPREVLLAAGSFPDFSTAEEYEVFLKIVERYPVDYVDAPLFKYRNHGENLSVTLSREALHLETIAIRRYWLERVPSTDRRARLLRELAATAHAGYGRWLLERGRTAEARRHFRISLQLNRLQHRYLHYALCALPGPLARHLLRAGAALVRGGAPTVGGPSGR